MANMFEKEKGDLHAVLFSKFERIGEHTDWVNKGDAKFSGDRRFVRERAIGDRLIVEYVEYSPDADPDYISARLERHVEDQNGNMLFGEASSFVKNRGNKKDEIIRSGISGPSETSITWNNKNNHTALENARKMVSRIK